MSPSQNHAGAVPHGACDEHRRRFGGHGHHVHGRSGCRKGLDTAEARKWRDALAADVNGERSNVERCLSDISRGHLLETVMGIDAHLTDLAEELAR